MRRSGRFALLGLLAATALVVAAVGAEARAGAGGSRGSRTYTAPARPASPTLPDRTTAVSPGPSPRRPGGGLGRGLIGLLLGGLVGGLLFGHHQGAGIGVLEVLLIAVGLLLLFAFLRRRADEPVPAYAGGGDGLWSPAGAGGANDGVLTAPAPDLQRGLGHIRTLDPRFDPAAFAGTARRVFLEVQDGVGARDLGSLRGRLTPEMRGILAGQVDQARSGRRTSRVEDVRFADAEVTEAWQEGGRDFVTVYFTGTLLDYTLDDATRQVVQGSRTTPQAFEEFWTFTRPVGPNGWQLSAIQGA